MTGSVSELFAQIRAHLPPWLDARALEWCAQIAEHIPDGASSHYLELRLNAGPEIDFLTCITYKQLAAQLKRRLGPSLSSAWQSNLTILDEWATPNSALSGAPLVYLEYDAGASTSDTDPEASLAVCVESNYQARQWQSPRATDLTAVELGKQLYRRLAPDAQREAWTAAIERCYAALPPGGAIPHVCVMSAREPITAKPYVVLPRANVLSFLRGVEWPGCLHTVQELLETYYAAFREHVYLDLTVTDAVQERLGLVTSQFQAREMSCSTLDWWRLPPELAAQQAALSEWTGYSEATLGGDRVWIQRWLDTKLVLCGEQIVYKAYLGFGARSPPLFC
jgi:hypothetical protein